MPCAQDRWFRLRATEQHAAATPDGPARTWRRRLQPSRLSVVSLRQPIGARRNAKPRAATLACADAAASSARVRVYRQPTEAHRARRRGASPSGYHAPNRSATPPHLPAPTTTPPLPPGSPPASLLSPAAPATRHTSHPPAPRTRPAQVSRMRREKGSPAPAPTRSIETEML